MSSQPGQNPTSRPSNTPKEAQKTLSPQEQEFSDIVKELKNGTIAGFVRRVSVGGRWADNPAEVALKTEVGNALAAMRKNCGSDERFARLVQEMVDILVNADKETLQIKSEAQKKISELKEVCRNEGGILDTAYTKSRRALFNIVPPEYRLPTKEEFERIDQLSPANLSIYEATLLKDEKKLKKFLNAWQENEDDKPWKDYVKVSHPESAKRLNSLFDRAIKYLGNSSIDNLSTNFNQAKEREIKATEIARLSASMLKDVSWLESTFTNGLVNNSFLIDYMVWGGTIKANIVGALPKIIELESQLIKLGWGGSEALKQLRALKHAAIQIENLAIRGGVMGGFKKNESSLLASALQSIQKKDIIVVAVTIESRGSDVLGSDLLGSNVGLISEKVVNVSIKSLTEQKRLYREKGLTDINPADFAHFLTGLEAEGSLTLAWLSDILTEKTARELILRWRNDTLAQKELAKRGTPTALAVLGKTKSLLKEYEQVLTEKMKSNPDLTRKLLTQAGIPKDHIERTFQLLAATKDFSIGLRAILASTLGGKSDAFVENFSKAISLDAGARAQKIESLGKLQKYNWDTQIKEFIGKLNQGVINTRIVKPEDREFLMSRAESFNDLKKDPKNRDRIFQLLEMIHDWKGMNEEEAKGYRGIKELLQEKKTQYHAAAVVQNSNLRRQLQNDASQVQALFKNSSDSQLLDAVKQQDRLSWLSRQVEQAATNIAKKESEKAESARKRGEEPPQEVLFSPIGAPSSYSEVTQTATRNPEPGGWSTNNNGESGFSSASYSTLSSQAIPFSSGDIYGALSVSRTPLDLGNCIIAQDSSGRVTIATPSERFTVEAREAPAILGLANISRRLNLPFLISSIPLLKPFLKKDDATGDGFSAREESELTARIGIMLGFTNLNPTDSSAQILRHMENQRDPRFSYEWLAQNRGLIGNNGRPIETNLVTEFKTAGASTAANIKEQIGDVPNFQTS